MSKKPHIFKTALQLFASQGYEATTTLQIAREAGVTEPAVFYHFKNKNVFFTTILEEASHTYYDHLDSLSLSETASFETLSALIRMHVSVVKEEPDFMRILLRTCPTRLDNPKSTCIIIYQKARSKLKALLTKILNEGISSGEFVNVDVDATANLLIAMLNGLMRQQIAGMDQLNGVENATIVFCRNALVVKE